MSHADLIKAVISLSESQTWRKARLEWFVKSMDEDESLESTCVCGHEHLRYLYTIENKVNGNQLYPIGSKCIKLFGSRAMDEDAEMLFKEWQLIECVTRFAHVYGKGCIAPFERIKPYLSRKFIAHMYANGAFSSSEYKFVTDMFNKRSEMTFRQRKKYYAIARESLYPYLRYVYMGQTQRKEPTWHASTSTASPRPRATAACRTAPTS